MSSSRRLNSKLKASESNENSNQIPIDSVSSHVPRSPLLSIQVPTHIDVNAVKGAVLTPKSAQVRSNPKNSGFRASKRDKESSKCLEKVDIGCFELDADLKFWEDHNVQVLIRIRPITSMESAIHGHKRCLIQNSSQTLTWTGHPETRFTFDHVACEAVTQEKLFRAVGLPMVNNCMLGYNSCMFAYGQTGSGKTYTMMGEIQEINKQLSDDRGMTPRVFEYLFTRIKEEEECQSEEKLKYNCKCSFLEIYNEQIIDLLEPTSTNLQLREDIKKGVYVENLKEYEVSSVKDVMELLLQGATNRKMASTHMNSESSRSHSVFTCVIESRREIDSLTHIRFGRLNLVDLAGSERQKSSGAEGERLKEAANINRSLSTLGLVIMTLVDVANGKNRHVPYRDSRLTFLLQDSLGGNSKTTIIANVSPSICSASETLSTLKFAQRAKLIQNNAKVNEDSSGDVMALQSQIQTLKDQLAVLLKHQNIPRSFCHPSLCRDQTAYGDQCDDSHGSLLGNETPYSDSCSLKNESEQLEASLIDSLRREELTEAAMRRLEDEIKHLSRLVHQREDDTQRVKTLLRFREEKLRRLELLADDLVTTDGYLMEENLALTKEIQLLKETMDKNPELTHFALENKRLLEELRMYQNFYEQGERDALLAEVSYLRNQLLKVIDGKFFPVNKDSSQEDRPAPKANIENQITSSEQADSVPSIKLYEVQNELSDARLLIKELENQQAQLLVELDKLKKENQKHTELSTIICTEMHIGEEPGSCPKVTGGPCNPAKFNHLNANELVFTAFGKEPDSNDLSCFSLAETRDGKLDSKSVYLIQENAKLSKLISKREEEMHSLSYEWEKAIVDLTTFLTDGWKSLDDASEYIESVVESLPLKSTYINEHVERAIKIFLEKEILILDLQRGLQEAQKKGKEMKQKLDSLRGATLAITGVQQLEYNEKSNELSTLRELLDEKNSVIHELETELKQKEEHIIEAVKVADASRKIITELYEMDYADLLNAGDIKSIIHELATMHTNLPINDIILSEGRVCCQTNRTCPVGIDDALRDVQERTNHANELLIRFDAVQDTMEEAEHVLKSLLKANEVTKKEKDIIKNKYVRFLKEISELISSLEESFQQIQRITHDGFNAICAGISSFQKEANNTIFSSRLCVEDMISEATGKSFELFVLYQCHRGALHGQPIHSNSYSNTDHHKHNRFSSVIGNEDISGNYICSDAFKIQRKHSPAKISMQDMLHIAEDPIDASVVDCKNKMLSSTQHCSDARFLQLEKENLNLTNDIELLKTVISELMTGSVKLKDEWVPGENLMQDGTATSSDASMPDSNEECDHDRTVNIFHDIKSDTENILRDIQCLRTQFIQPNSSKLAEKDYIKYIEITNAKTEIGNQTMQAWNRLINKVNYLLPLIPTIVQSQLGKNPTNSLERSFVDICNIEVKVCNLLEKCHRYENTNQSVNEEMERKDKLINGLLFDISLLQESSFNAKSTKVELEEITADYNLVCQELKVRTTQMEALKSRLAEYESDLSNSRMELDKTHDTLIRLSDENKKLNLLLDDAHFKYCQNEELLEHKQKVIEGLQSDILAFNSSVEGKLISSNEDIMKELIKVCNEKDGLQAEIANLTDRLEMASALADENEAIAIEARQVAETSKIYAEEKEEEVKVLEHSVEELEDTIDILEKKVYDMKVEVEENHSMRKMLELEVQTLTQRMFRVENAAGNLIAEYSNTEGERYRIPRKLDDKIIELCEARQRIEDFELEKSYTEEEIKQYQEYISELVLHSEAQSSLYKEKYKELEAMVSEVKHASSKQHNNQNGEKVERNASRTRGSGSPFRCISSLVQQMNLEKDRELSEARNRVEELEALAAHRQKEICMLNARLAAADSMTHDVIRDLMGVKLDMSNYAHLIDQEQIQDILRKAQKQHEEAVAKEQEILDLRELISRLVEERESWIEEINQRKADVLANEVLLERLKHRERKLAAQNEMLKIDKGNLRRRIAELDEKLKAIVGSHMNGESSLKFKDGISTRAGNEDHLSRRLAQSDKLLSHVRTSMKKST